MRRWCRAYVSAFRFRERGDYNLGKSKFAFAIVLTIGRVHTYHIEDPCHVRDPRLVSYGDRRKKQREERNVVRSTITGSC